ncbi:hypothetical protein [Anoxybacillus sp. ST4]|uniref:hypothetical protein n=1 Tax=Anoxybacillus sp. ST4 TaxID=2864181 RepID=UPI001C641193|nr:hypothetical protein [Anoxybacillus sp. ST4]MBW7649800.1 hypothetical protein [Anoxybacillus sp. ST4]
MPHKFAECECCQTKFKAKKMMKKDIVGFYKGDPVYHHYYECVRCKYKHTVKIDTPSVNIWTDRMFMLKWYMRIHRNDERKYEELAREYEVVRGEVEKVIEDVKKVVGIE